MRMKISGLTGGWPPFSKVRKTMTFRTGEPPRIIASPTSEDMGHPTGPVVAVQMRWDERTVAGFVGMIQRDS